MFELEALSDLLGRFRERRIGLVGDLFLDRYLELEPHTHELSVETGLEAYQISVVRNHPGALGTIMANLAALGVGAILPLTVVGDDGHGYDLIREVERLPAETQWILQGEDRLTPTYTKPLRWVDERWRELNRLDIRTRQPLSDALTQRVVDRLGDLYEQSEGLIVLDQIDEPECGVINRAVRQRLAELAVGDKPIYVDSRAQLSEFGFGILKGNEAELARLVDSHDSTDLPVALGALSQRTGQPVVCTLGERGILLGFPDRTTKLVEGFPASGPVDIVGAGDAATSGIMLSLLSGASMEQAALIGNLVASITVQQLGTTGTATPAEVASRWREWKQRL